MNIIIVKKDIDLTPALEDYLQKKFAQLEKFVDAIGGNNPAELTIEVEKTTNHHQNGFIYKTSAKVHVANITLRANAEAEDIHAAIDGAKDILRGEIEKYKDRSLK
jgi:ribosomal subunit interface protein